MSGDWFVVVGQVEGTGRMEGRVEEEAGLVSVLLTN